MEKTKKTKILIIDDDVQLVKIYKSQFEKKWFDVITEQSWYEWISSAKENKPDIILIDISLWWDTDGFKVLNLINNYAKFDPMIIAISNLSDENTINTALNLWATDFIFKVSNSPTEIVIKIEELMLTERSY